MVKFKEFEIKKSEDEMEEVLYEPLLSSGKAYYILVGVLLAIIGLGAYAYYTQLQEGLVVTGMRDVVFWGVYITNLIFFIGISYGGTLVSGILRVTRTEWRRPITRIAEAVTVFALIVAIPMIIVDLGRPERLHHFVLYGRIESPLTWDFISIGTYLVGSLIYLYVCLIPDMAICRDNLFGVSSWKRKLYKWLSLGWTGTEEQKRRLEKGIAVMPIVLIPVAISAHTVLAWVFGVTTRAGWHSTIFGPYFVVAAIFSGIASIIIVMAILRRVYHLEDYIKPAHLKNLAYMLLVLDLAYIYFTISEYLTSGYAGKSAEAELLNSIFGGQYYIFFWTFLIGGLLVPAFIVAIPKTRTITGIVTASIFVVIAMWIKRYIIIVPALARPMLPYSWGVYWPTWVEWSITAAGFAVFILLYLIFSKISPMISIWEVRESATREEGRA